jgi:hypothetical protein
LPWHRAFLHDFEVALGMPVPYWDWSGDSQAPHNADVLSAAYFGGNGDPSNKNCVTNGQFTLENGWDNTVGQSGCLTRCFDQGSRIGVFYSPEPVAAMISASSNYSVFRQAFEAGPHGRVHVGIGGNCGCKKTIKNLACD